jgi:RNA polymerase sigma-70 factor (ECF subfamily)
MPPAAAPRSVELDGAPPAAPASAALTRAIARGDQVAFAEFYDLWFDRAYATARRITRRDESFCLDVVHDAMLRVVRQMRPLDSEAAVGAWMARTIWTTAIDALRTERRRTRREHDVGAERAANADAPGDGTERERLEWLRARIAALPTVDRRLVQERFDHDRTLDAVGRALGMTGHAAHGRIRRILARLRDAAKELFDD